MPRGSLETLAADLDFPALRHAVDPGYILSCLSGACGASPAGLREIDVLNHKPGRRCTVRYTVGTQNGDFAIVGKWYRAPGQAQAMQALLSSLLAADLSLPEVVYSSPDVVMQRYVAGKELRDLVPAEDTAPFGAAGAWLARLHAVAGLPGLKPKSTTHELAKVEAWCRELATELPLHADALRSLSQGLSSLAPSLSDAPRTPIHRDYYPANLLWDGETLWGIDFDQMALGDPAMDAGTFLAQMEKIVIRDGLSPRHVEAKSRAFIAAYGDAADARHFGTRLSFFKSYTFLKLAAAEVQRRRERWQELTVAFIARAVEEASEAR